jgi:hypothetical protein
MEGWKKKQRSKGKEGVRKRSERWSEGVKEGRCEGRKDGVKDGRKEGVKDGRRKEGVKERKE